MKYKLATLALFAAMSASSVVAQQTEPAPAPAQKVDCQQDSSKKHKKVKKEKKRKEKKEEPPVDNSYLF